MLVSLIAIMLTILFYAYIPSTFSLGGQSLHVFCLFSNLIFFFFTVELRVLYVLQILVLCWLCGLRIFSPCLQLAFSFLGSSFGKQMSLI